MVNEHALTVSLEEFGLSKYEAQAYVSLIAKGTISASELAYYSEIPRTKIYPTLLKLTVNACSFTMIMLDLLLGKIES